jgi:hypothetical protein
MEGATVQLFWHWYDIDVGPGRYGLWYSGELSLLGPSHRSPSQVVWVSLG